MYVDLNIVDLLCKREQGYKHEQNYQLFGGCVYHSYWWFFPLEEDLLLCMFNGSWGGGFVYLFKGMKWREGLIKIFQLQKIEVILRYPSLVICKSQKNIYLY